MKRLLLIAMMLLALAAGVQARTVIGNQAADSADQTISPNQVYVLKVQATATENSDTIYFHAFSDWGTGVRTVHVVIYSDNAGVPGTKLAESGNINVTASPGAWFKGAVSTALTSGTHYWIGIWDNDATDYVRIQQKKLPADTLRCKVTDATPLESTYPSSGRDCYSNSLSIYLVSGVVTTYGPTISGIDSSQLSSTSERITFNTDSTCTDSVSWGTTTSYTGTPVVHGTGATSHTVDISSLTAATQYHFKITVKDGSGDTSASADHTFTTAAASTAKGVKMVNVKAKNCKLGGS